MSTLNNFSQGILKQKNRSLEVSNYHKHFAAKINYDGDELNLIEHNKY